MAGTTYALVISVENYHQTGHLPKVRYANKDAIDLCNTLIEIGVDKNNIHTLQDDRATKTAIIAELNLISNIASSVDTIIFYFAGHGVYSNSQNYLAPVDTYKTDVINTCVSINQILGVFKKTACKRNILFLDCCHSGFQAGDETRDVDSNFVVDDLIYQYSKEEYCIGFASCKGNQKSISSDILKNGVWSHFLIKALQGEAKNIYEEGLLFSDKLQSYLNKNVVPFVKLNTEDKKDQNPIVFGSQTDRFIIANLNPIFEKKAVTKESSDLSLINISLIDVHSARVKMLPGFIKGSHFEPERFSNSSDSFIKSLGHSLIDDEISSLSEEIKGKINYKRKEIEADSGDGSGTISTPDFTYTIVIEQSDRKPDEYFLIRKLTHFRNSELVLTPVFNSIFSNHFDTLEFELSNKLNIEDIIDKIEDLGDESDIKVYYNPKKLDSCTISIKGLKDNITLTNKSFSIRSSNSTSPDRLINAFKESYKVMLATPNLKMLK